MSILQRLSHSSMAGSPFVDYLNISTPLDSFEDLKDQVLSVLDGIGSFEEIQPGLFQYFELIVRKGVLAPVPRGTVKFSKRGKVGLVSASGWVLGMLRDRGLYSDYLAAIASFPHRITMMHVTADFYTLTPAHYIQAVKHAAFTGALSLTRKAITTAQCRAILQPNRDGLDTGTVYLGQRCNADVWAKIYDKQHERLDKGFPDPGPKVRIEIACMSGVGATLRDASDPRDVFFHYACRSLVDAPPDFAGWLPYGEGYVLGEKRERTLFDRFDALLAGSLDIRRLAEMAVKLYGREVAPHALGRRVIALVRELGVGSPENVTEGAI